MSHLYFNINEAFLPWLTDSKVISEIPVVKFELTIFFSERFSLSFVIYVLYILKAKKRQRNK